jgi:hypothetical protein
MARRTFFSFHYKPDVHRAMNVRKSGVFTNEEDGAGFFDSSVFESKQRTSDDALKRFLSEGLSGCSVTAALYATATSTRRWVRFELLKSFLEGKGILSIAIHTIKNLDQQAALPGTNPLAVLGVEVRNGIARPKENLNGAWQWASDVEPIANSRLPYGLGVGADKLFSDLFPTYDWAAHQGRSNMGGWIEAAAKAVGR